MIMPSPLRIASTSTRLSTVLSSSKRTFSTSSPRFLAEATATADPTTPVPVKTLHGTVGHHNLYLLLHTHQPPLTYPSKKSSPLHRALTLKFARWGTVNWGYRDDLVASLPSSSVVGSDGNPEEATRIEDEVYRATAYSSAFESGVLEIPRLSVENMEDVHRTLRSRVMPDSDTVDPQSPSPPTSSSNPASTSDSTSDTHSQIHLYVCTHMQRDCRCGDIGGALVTAMKDEVEKRSLGDTVKVGEVGHIGGHAWAANMLVYPHGEWLGLLKPSDAPSVLDAILALPRRPVSPDAPPLCPPTGEDDRA